MAPSSKTSTISNANVAAVTRALHSLAEIADRHALRVAVVSAAGRVSFGLCADADAVNRLELVSQRLAAEIEALLQ